MSIYRYIYYRFVAGVMDDHDYCTEIYTATPLFKTDGTAVYEEERCLETKRKPKVLNWIPHFLLNNKQRMSAYTEIRSYIMYIVFIRQWTERVACTS